MASARKSRAVTTAIHQYWIHIATGKWCKPTSGESRKLITCNRHVKTSRFELLIGFAIGRVRWYNIVNGAHNKQLLSYGKMANSKDRSRSPWCHTCIIDGHTKAFQQRRDLIDHPRTHTGDLPFVCDFEGAVLLSHGAGR